MAVKLEGPLSKWTNVVKGWQYRWFVLDENTGLLSYYTSKDKMMRGARRGCLRLRGAQIGIDDDDDSTFTISSDQKIFHFQARDSKERENWIKALEETINCHSQNDKFPAFSVPTEEELNHRMAEAEAYFRILTQQVKTLENQINGTTSEKMIESIGQTLELLNLAKTTMLKKMPVPILSQDSSIIKPVASEALPTNQESVSLNGSSDSRTQSTEAAEKELNTGKEIDSNGERSSAEIGHDFEDITVNSEANTVVQTPVVPKIDIEEVKDETAALPLENKNGLSDDGNMDNSSLIAALRAVETVPCTSYSSSDDDDDDDDAEFFDANEYNEITGEDVQASTGLGHTSELLSDTVISMSFTLSLFPDLVVSYCEEDDDDAEKSGQGGPVEQQGSVITHLLSQVKIGMDLTKVTLPTFILERRSLLEMYADFFAHPDIFKGIPDLKDPKSRMIQVLKWYLSSFHAGRKGSVAKKPYNPILGEIFQCKYDLTDEKSNSTDDVVSDGPVAFATKEDVSFLAEQVSHHPPISAFYAECYNKRICFNSYIWTKSKFLGLSIGVNMVGEGRTYVLDHDEEYTMTFPSAYGRSILTVPWVELGGKTEITCAKTGYRADVEFHTKPFYGGKRHRVTAEVFGPGDKKPIMSVNGEWNGVMYAMYPNQKEPEVFVDTFTMPIVKKQVQSIAKQQKHESRRLWQEVTRNLKMGNIEKATEAKHGLEERQRADAKERKEKDTKWMTRDFDEYENATFVYKQPLWKRLPSN
eukprot:gene4515-20767_t